MKPLVSRNDLPGRCGGRCCTKRRGEEKYIDSLKAEAECQYLVVVVVEVEVDLCGNRVNVAERFRFTKKLRWWCGRSRWSAIRKTRDQHLERQANNTDVELEDVDVELHREYGMIRWQTLVSEDHRSTSSNLLKLMMMSFSRGKKNSTDGSKTKENYLVDVDDDEDVVVLGRQIQSIENFHTTGDEEKPWCRCCCSKDEEKKQKWRNDRRKERISDVDVVAVVAVVVDVDLDRFESERRVTKTKNSEENTLWLLWCMDHQDTNRSALKRRRIWNNIEMIENRHCGEPAFFLHRRSRWWWGHTYPPPWRTSLGSRFEHWLVSK